MIKKGLFYKVCFVVSLTLVQLFPLAGFSQSPANSTNSGLISPDTGVDYTKLKDLLAAGDWRKANDATTELVLKSVGRDVVGWMSVEDLKKMSCWDLGTIDRLWKEYSKGRFGFSAQFPIFIATGNKPGRLVAIENYQEFGDQVGWRNKNDWIIFKENLGYSLDSPTGHLPSLRSQYQISGNRFEYSTLAQRMVTCNLVSIPSGK
ncbi:MAG: hypothetical protein N5P05_000372 [Chroococcopsis gigantea SAG 12.99]|jgi:hypothetical protein|nr:GUN4 domain-containing protein [Chlorogloea purpurea SAG 13.99]MDV2998766.1 hypothetical protein [Chroococcopsis gigantea SAG 12.99]